MRWRIVSIVLAVAAVLSTQMSSEAAQALPRRGAPDAKLVRTAQQTLEGLGYEPGPADGILGPRTSAALASYQRSARIPVTGRLDTETMVRLDIEERVFSPRHRRLGHLGDPRPAPARAPLALAYDRVQSP